MPRYVDHKHVRRSQISRGIVRSYDQNLDRDYDMRDMPRRRHADEIPMVSPFAAPGLAVLLGLTFQPYCGGNC